MVLQPKNVRVEVGIIPKEKKKNIVYFSSFEEMNKVLTPKRVELLSIIKAKSPESIYDLAQILNRDQGNVTRDVNLLEKYGFIEIKKQKQGKRIKSQPTYEKGGIEMIIKIGAGTFGLAKEMLENVTEEFKGENLETNKNYTKKAFKKSLKPLAKTAKKIAKSLDELDKE